MCIICIEFNKKRMTRDEVRKALSEMIMFANSEEEKNHFKKLQVLGEAENENEFIDFIDDQLKKSGKK